MASSSVTVNISLAGVFTPNELRVALALGPLISAPKPDEVADAVEDLRSIVAGLETARG